MYKKQITERIKEKISSWIEELKLNHPELLLTKQWNVKFPKGFVAGHNVLPVLTGSKKGKHLVGEVQFILPDNLELDVDAIELGLKNEPYSEKPKKKSNSPAPLDEPLDVLNELIVGINDFLQEVSMPVLSENTAKPVFSSTAFTSKAKPITILNGSPVGTTLSLDSIQKELISSPYLPEWFKTIDSYEVRSGLLSKIAEALAQYRTKMGNISLKEFFEKYTDHLKSQNKLYHYCKYKAKPVNMDERDNCNESYCSKKPYSSSCSNTVLRFGAPDKGGF